VNAAVILDTAKARISFHNVKESVEQITKEQHGSVSMFSTVAGHTLFFWAATNDDSLLFG